jgi:hypothetical protein
VGTSQSKPSPPGGSPLVPPWADQDPPPPDQPQPPPGADVLPASPLAGTRRALRDYMGTGDVARGRTALGRYARAVGGGGASARHARAARTGGAAIGGFAAAARGQPGADGFDLGQLAGLPMEAAIDAIVDRFCPPGILDEELVRAAITEALVESLDGADVFDPAAIDDRTVVIATVCFVAELVFASVMAEQGHSADQVDPARAVRRENALRDLVREVADHVATPIVQRNGGALAPAQIENIVVEITSTVYGELAEW